MRGIVEGRIWARFARALVAGRVGDEVVESGFVGFEGLGIGAETEDFHLHGIALADFGEEIEAADHAAEDIVLIVEAVLGTEHEAELRSIGIGAIVAHLDGASGVVAETGNDFVGEKVAGVPVTSGGGITSLDDEIWDHSAPSESVVEGFAGRWAEGAFG